jgi:hypothetical protein
MRRRKSEKTRSLEGRICTPLLHYYDWRGLITSDTRAVWSFFGQAKKLGKNRGIRYGEDVESKMLDRGMFLVSCITILDLNTCCSFLNAKCAPIEPSGGCWIRFFGLHRLQEGAGQKREKFSLTASSGVLHNEVRHRGIATDTAAFTSRTAHYVIPTSHNQFCQGSLPYITTTTR